MKIQRLAQQPPMGWNSFDSYGCAANEEVTLENLEVFAQRLKPAGYEYFVIDNGWFGEYSIPPDARFPRESHASDVRIDEYGRYIPAKVSFPNGLTPIIDRVHALGLKFGIHVMRGISRKAVELNTPIKGTPYHARDVANVNDTCVWCHYNYGVDMDKPGAQAFYNSWVDLLAEMGVDFIKADDIVPYPREIVAIADAIEQCGRDIVLSLSPGRLATPENIDIYRRANMVRITHDIWDRRADLDKCFEAWERFAGTEKPGFWPDLDMICLGHLQVWRPREEHSDAATDDDLVGAGFDRMDRYTLDQKQTFMATRAMAATPLFMGGALPTTDETVFSLITNAEMIACNQNGVMGRKIHEEGPLQIWKTPEKDAPGSGWLGLFNRSDSAIHAEISLETIGLQDSVFTNVWTGERPQFNQGISTEIGADGVCFLKYKPMSQM